MLPVLGLAVLSTWLVTVAFPLLLVDIASSFNVQVGTASMVASVGSISGVAFGLLMSFLNVRFNHKPFLLLGLVGTCIAALGYFAAPTFALALLPNIGVGAGIAMVTSMAYAIIGDVYPLEKRGRAVGAIVASTTLAYVVGAPTIGLIDNFTGSWRYTIILIALPFALASLVLAALVVPNKPHANPLPHREPFMAGCKTAFSNKSTIAALLVTMFMLAKPPSDTTVSRFLGSNST